MLLSCSQQTSTLSVDEWLSARQSEIPKPIGVFQWNGVSRYENQIITELWSSDSRVQNENKVFDLVTSAVCRIEDIDTLWQNEMEFYSSVKDEDDKLLHTVQTKSFDCCVLEKSSTMSVQNAQNSCDYK